MSEWIKYEGEGQPVPNETLVNWRYQNQEEEEGPFWYNDDVAAPAEELDWNIEGKTGDITYYRVVEEEC